MSLVHLDDVEHGCCGPAARADAAEVARIAGFAFEICDLTGEFERGGDRRLRGRACGRAHAEPVRAVQRRDQVRRVPAAGRRARRRPGRDRPLRARRAGRRRRVRLLRGADAAKDQIVHAPHAGPGGAAPVAVPGGRHAEARDARRTRERFGLPVAAKPDSQELCFAPSGDAGGVRPRPGARARARRRRDRGRGRAGCSASTTARSAFTVGQRRGLGVATGRAATCVESTPPRTASSSGPRSCSRGAGLVADRVSWVAGRAARRTGRSRPRSGSGTAARTSRAVVTPERRRLRVEFAPRSAPWRPARASSSTAATSSWAVRRIVEARPLRRVGSARLSSRSPGPRRAVKLLKRRPKSFDIQVHDMVLHITASPEYAEESRASALSFWEQLQSYALRDPAFRESKRAIPIRGRPRHRAGDDRVRGPRRRGTHVHLPGRGHRRGGAVPLAGDAGAHA